MVQRGIFFCQKLNAPNITDESHICIIKNKAAALKEVVVQRSSNMANRNRDIRKLARKNTLPGVSTFSLGKQPVPVANEPNSELDQRSYYATHPPPSGSSSTGGLYNGMRLAKKRKLNPNPVIDVLKSVKFFQKKKTTAQRNFKRLLKLIFRGNKLIFPSEKKLH